MTKQVLIAHCSLLIAHCSLLSPLTALTAHCSLLSLLMAHCSWLTAHGSLLTAHGSLLSLLMAHCSLLIAHCSLLRLWASCASQPSQLAPSQHLCSTFAAPLFSFFCSQPLWQPAWSVARLQAEPGAPIGRQLCTGGQSEADAAGLNALSLAGLTPLRQQRSDYQAKGLFFGPAPRCLYTGDRRRGNAAETVESSEASHTRPLPFTSSPLTIRRSPNSRPAKRRKASSDCVRAEKAVGAHAALPDHLVHNHMPPTRSKAKMKEKAFATTNPAADQNTAPIEPRPTRETVLTAPIIDTPTTSPTFQPPAKTPPRRVLRLRCPNCNDYPDGFRSEHELRRHTNRVHRKLRKVWMTVDTSPDKTFLANCKACQTGKRYNECYNAASHLRRMHFHPHKRGERKMTAAEARRGGKPGDLDPPMEVLKAKWLREVDEIIEGEQRPYAGAKADLTSSQVQPQPQPKTTRKSEGKAPPTPTTPSTRSMAIDSIVDKVDDS